MHCFRYAYDLYLEIITVVWLSMPSYYTIDFRLHIPPDERYTEYQKILIFKSSSRSVDLLYALDGRYQEVFAGGINSMM